MTERLRIPGLVSTIIPVYNRAALLQQAVHSVLEQTYRPIEIVIVDDGSTDETLQCARALAAEHPVEIIVLQQPNGGPGVARETGRQRARGEFIQYLDSDDVLLPRKFELQVAGFRSEIDCGVSYGQTKFRRADGTFEPSPWKGSGTFVGTMFPSFLVNRWWDTPTPLYRAEVCDRAGAWVALRLEEDWEYDCRVAALGIKLHYVPEYVAEVRDHGESRLSRGQALDPSRLAMRAHAHALIHSHAIRGGIPNHASEMAHFSRALFLLSRQCGAAGLSQQSKQLFDLARSSSAQGAGHQMRMYEAMARLFGWTCMGKLSCLSDRMRLQ